MLSILVAVHDYLFEGTLRVGADWGGDDCYAYVPIDVHIKESLFWVVLLSIIGLYLHVGAAMKRLQTHAATILPGCPSSSTQRTFEALVATLFFAMFTMLLCIKFKDKAMINLAQPCHLLLILQGIALLSQDSTGVFITLFMLPPLTGAISAMAMPAVNGLSPIEILNFWVQHVLLAIVPFYLLCRRNFAATRLCTSRLLVIGLWMFALSHFTFYELVGLSFKVNPQFMLCPTFAMRDVFSTFHPTLLLPSYRTTVTVIFSAMALANAHLYYYISKGVLWLLDWTQSKDTNYKSD